MKTSLIAALAAIMSVVDPPDGAILALTGASCIEELSESEIERFCRLCDHPVDINHASASKLSSTGLFSPYQLASIIDYRTRTGKILSFAELGLVDGFNPQIAEALRYFVTLSASPPAGGKVSQSVIASGGIRIEDRTTSWGLKYRISLDEFLELNLSDRMRWSDSSLSFGTLSGAWYFRKVPGKLIVGDFSARFGQGLAVWSGFSLSGYSSIQAFRKNGNGFSSTGSFSSDLRGVAADINLGAWTLGAAWSFDGMLPIVNVTRTGKQSTWGITATSELVSAECRFSLPGTSLFGETVLRRDGSWAALAGTVYTPAYGTRLALQARFFSASFASQISGIAAGYENSWLLLTVDVGHDFSKDSSQHRMMFRLCPSFACGPFELKPSLRVNERFRPGDNDKWRTDIRLDLEALSQECLIHARYNALWMKQFASLFYLECGYRNAGISVYLRGGAFLVDNWDDRIYVYERDAPGSFNVPAYYGRGWNASVSGSWKPGRRHTIRIRLGIVQYPWTKPVKQGRTELKIQYEWK